MTDLLIYFDSFTWKQMTALLSFFYVGYALGRIDGHINAKGSYDKPIQFRRYLRRVLGCGPVVSAMARSSKRATQTPVATSVPLGEKGLCDPPEPYPSNPYLSLHKTPGRAPEGWEF